MLSYLSLDSKLEFDSSEDVLLNNFYGSKKLVRISIYWKPKGPLMVKASYDGLSVDAFPMTETIDDSNVALLIPGSSIKGALRDMAEKIIRTILNLDIASVSNFDEQVKVPLVDILFGSAKRKKQNEKNTDKNTSINFAGQSILFFTDCYSKSAINQSNWDSIINSSNESSLNESLERIDERFIFQESYHVAIDRWTNAVLDGALYTVLEPHNIEWEPIEIIFDFNRIKFARVNCENYANEETIKDEDIYKCSLLLLVLRDFSRGDIPLGFATTRGMDDIEVESKKLEGDSFNLEIRDGKIESKSLPLDELQKKWSIFLDNWR